MVAATFVPTVRRTIPRALELGLWLSLICVCTLAIVGVADPGARELTSSALWGVDQIINTAVGLALGGLVGWIADNRFVIATALALFAAIDLVIVAFVRLVRASQGWQPRVRLGEWMEMPSPAKFASEPSVRADRRSALNRRLTATTALAGARVWGVIVTLAISMSHAVLIQGAQRLARAAAVGLVESRALLESVRHAGLHLQFAARAWYAVAGAPVVNHFGIKLGEAMRLAGAGELRHAATGQVIDLPALISAQSIGWYGPLSPGAPIRSRTEQDVAESDRSESLAS